MTVDCQHENFTANVGVRRLTDDGGGPVRNYIAEIEVRCVDCNEPFHFVGPQTGFSFHRPTVNVGATMLHAPIAPGVGPLPTNVRFETPSKERS